MKNIDRFDVIFAVGALLIAAGAALIYVPLGFIVAGGALIGLSLLGARTLGPAPTAEQKDKSA
jgi:hypothetical protein